MISAPRTAGTQSLVRISYAGMFLFGVILTLMGSLLPLLPRLSPVQVGLLGSVPVLGILVSTIFTGPLLDRWGPRPVLSSGLLLVTAGLAALPWLRGFPAMETAAFIYGLGGGVLNTATNALVSMIAAAGRGAALNRLGACFSLGAITAPLLMAALLSLAAHPAVLALDSLALLALLLALPVLGLRFPATQSPTAGLRNSLRPLMLPIVWAMSVLLFFESGTEITLFNWAGHLAQLTAGAGARQAEWLLTGLTAALGLARLFAGYQFTSHDSRKLLAASAALLAAGAGLGWAAPAFSHRLLLLAGALLLLGLGMATVYPTVLAIAGDRFPQSTGATFSVLMTMGLVGGWTATHLSGHLVAANPQRLFLIPLADALALATLGWVVARSAAASPSA